MGVQASMKDLPEDGSRMEETVNLFLEFEKAQAHIFHDVARRSKEATWEKCWGAKERSK